MQKKSKKFSQALRYVQQQHRGQTRAGGMPVWHHLLRTSSLLQAALRESGEGTPQMQDRIVRAALGHDLFEDTKAQRDEARRIFGSYELTLIEYLTNDHGDEDVRPYVKKMRKTPEEARLIKLADHFDNVTHVACALTELGVPWVRSTFLPTVEPMWKTMRQSRFTAYPSTARILIRENEKAFFILRSLLKQAVGKTVN